MTSTFTQSNLLRILLAAETLCLPFVIATILFKLGHHGAIDLATLGLGAATFLIAALVCTETSVRTPVSVGKATRIGACAGIVAGGTWLSLYQISTGTIDAEAIFVPYLWVAMPGAIVGGIFAMSVWPIIKALNKNDAHANPRYRNQIVIYGMINATAAVALNAIWTERLLYVSPCIVVLLVFSLALSGNGSPAVDP